MIDYTLSRLSASLNHYSSVLPEREQNRLREQLFGRPSYIPSGCTSNTKALDASDREYAERHVRTPHGLRLNSLVADLCEHRPARQPVSGTTITK